MIASAAMRLLTAAVVLGFGLACSGLGDALPVPSASAPSEPAPAAAAPEPAAAAPETQGVAGAYTANVYGVCRKYADCKCSLYDSVDACVAEFGDAKDVFPPEVWGCVLARDCEGLCVFNAGTCFEIYALQYTKGSKKGAADCPAGTLPVEVYDLHGDYVRTECKE